MPKPISEIRAESREALAELEHEQWIAWSNNIAETENITPERLARWKLLWRPYSELSEAEKNQDREWGDKAADIAESRILQAVVDWAEEKMKEEEHECHMMCCGSCGCQDKPEMNEIDRAKADLLSDLKDYVSEGIREDIKS